MTAIPSRWLRNAAFVAGIAVPALMLPGCGSGRDRELSERLVAAQVAAERAEAASLIAQKAAARVSVSGVPQVAVADEAAEPAADATEPGDADDAAEKDPADETADSAAFDNTVVSLPAPPPPQPMPPAA